MYKDCAVVGVHPFGCFVELYTGKEGLVHVSLLGGPIGGKAHDLVKRGQPCYVKVLSVTGTKLSLSMKDADQGTGADLAPHMRLPGQAGPSSCKLLLASMREAAALATARSAACS